MPRQPRIAFLGTGIMGSHMARRLAQAGFAVTAWNRSAAKVEALASAGVQRATSVTDAVARADVVLVMLSTGDVVDEVLFSSEDAPVEAIASGATLVVMSSIPVETCRRQAESLRGAGVHYVDAPVSGGEVGARDGTLAILAGGDADIVEKVGAVFEPLGRVTHIGPIGAGQAAKLANQIIVGGTMVAVAEALHFAARNGADPAKVRIALAGGFGDSKILHLHGTRMVERDFVPGSPAEYQLKDLRTAQSLAKSLSLDLTLLNTLARMFGDMIDHEGTGIDVSGILLEVERRSVLPAS
jgi:2-hydroxy-3-oxopropionate reductase